VQLRPSVGAQANQVAGVGGDFGLEQDQMQHAIMLAPGPASRRPPRWHRRCVRLRLGP
jgi:hypothetical protein